MMQQKEFNYNDSVANLTSLLDQERAAGRTINGLEEIERRTVRHAEIRMLWEQIQQPIQRLKQRVDGLPIPPPAEQIAWAQSVIAMPAATLMEIDTTGTGNDDDLVRVTLADVSGNVFYDQLIKPVQATLSTDASQRNGLVAADLEAAPRLEDVWPGICRAFSGRYVIAFGQEWDVRMLKTIAERYGLPPAMVIGEDVQRRCTAYYLKEYYLSLEKIAARMGHTSERRDAPSRLLAQAVILAGMSQGITDLSKSEEAAPTESSSVEVISADDGLGSLDEHPF